MTTIEQLDRYLDHELPKAEAQQLEEQLRQDTDLQQLLTSVQLVRESVQSRALSLHIRRIHDEYLEAERAEQSPVKIIQMPGRQSFTWALRIAASLLLGMTVYSGYEFTTLNTGQYFETKFISYQLPVVRGNAESRSSLESLYATGNYAALTQQFTKLTIKEPRDYFLTAMAHLQRKEFDQAIRLFSVLRYGNTKRSIPYYSQESDYYLALAYVGANRLNEAQTLFEQIQNTPRHIYSRTVTDFDLFKLKLLLIKA